MSTNDPRNVAWGQPLLGDKTELVMGSATGLTGPMTQYLPNIMDPNAVYLPTFTIGKSSEVKDATARLKKMMAQLEVDINYFNTFKGQGMAVNKFGVMKFDLNEILALLEK